MKNIITLLLLLITYSASYAGGCFPMPPPPMPCDYSMVNQDSIYYPDTNINLYHAIQGTFYSTECQFFIGQSIIGIAGDTIPFDSVKITAIDGLPPELTYWPYIRNSSDGRYSCIRIYNPYFLGNPTFISSPAGIYQLTIHTTYYTAQGVILNDISVFEIVIDAPPTAQISGNVFYDWNLNGINDAGDTPASNKYVEFNQNSSHANTNSNGDFVSYFYPGNYTATVSNVPTYYTVSPYSITISVPDSHSTSVGNNFAIQPIPGIHDLAISGYTTGIRPGFQFTYRVTACNVGTETESGSVSLFFDNQNLQYLSATPSPDGNNGNQLNWDFTSLPPLQCLSFNVVFKCDSATALGTQIRFSNDVNPIVGDTTPANNSTEQAFTVRGSFDPNDKAVSPEGAISPEQVAAGQELTYTVRFQNTGTAEAINVKIFDMLSANLDITSFRLLSQSHPMTYTINSNRLAIFKFDNIMLADSNANEPASHGFITYSIRVNTDLQINNVINNTAQIYFDYNVAAVTNTVSTLVTDVVTGLFESPNKDLSLSLYPNPADGAINYELKAIHTGTVNLKLRDMLGREILSLPNQTATGKLDLPNLHGLFMIEAQSNGKTVVGKMVLQ